MLLSAPNSILLLSPPNRMLRLSPPKPPSMLLSKTLPILVIWVTLLLETIFGLILEISFCCKKLSAKSNVSVSSLTFVSSLKFLSVNILSSFLNFFFSISHDFYYSTTMSNFIFHLCKSIICD